MKHGSQQNSDEREKALASMSKVSEEIFDIKLSDEELFEEASRYRPFVCSNAEERNISYCVSREELSELEYQELAKIPGALHLFGVELA
ncbi:MAG: hypothetical protein JST12_08920 [Armatimonadetes bacterium]|nr:hypothetical protein [Armatimonadota bacterium]